MIFNPKTVQNSEALITRKHDGFSVGVLDDIVSSKITDRGVKYAKNYYLKNDGAYPRGGCQQWGKWSTGVSHATLPTLRTGYSWSKTGYVVTKTVGDDFTSADVGRYIIHDDGGRERIEAVDSTTEVTVAVNTARDASTSATVGGAINLLKFHYKTKKIVLQIDTELYISDDIYITNWIKCHSLTNDYALLNQVSTWQESGNYGFIGSQGTYKLDLSNVSDLTGTPPTYYKINTPAPTVRITDVVETETKTWARKYIYEPIRLTGVEPNRNRFTDDTTIGQITCPVALDAENKDYGLVYTDRPIGDESTTYSFITGATPTSPWGEYETWTESTYYQKIVSAPVETEFQNYLNWNYITSSSMDIPISGTVYTLSGVSFFSATSMGGEISSVASIIQTQLRVATGGAETVEYDETTKRFTITTEKTSGETVGYGERDGVQTYFQKLSGTIVPSIYRSHANWLPITDGKLRIVLGTSTVDIVAMDFSSVTSMGTLEESPSGSVARVIQDVINGIDPSLKAEVRYDSGSTDSFYISLKYSGSTIGLGEDSGAGATQLYQIMAIDSGSSATVGYELYRDKLETLMAIDSLNGTISNITDVDVTDIQFTLADDTGTYDFSLNTLGVKSMKEVAEIFTYTIRDTLSNVTVEWVTDHFEAYRDVSGGILYQFVAVSTPGLVRVIDLAGLSVSSGAVGENLLWSKNLQIGTLTMPINPANSRAISHLTHYAVFGTLDVGKEGINPQTGKGNNSERFVWVEDVPVCKAFLCGRAGNTVTIYLSEGEFSVNDIGSTITFSDSTTAVIDTFVSTAVVTTTTSGSVTIQSASLGASTIINASQATTTITKTAGGAFTTDDVGKVIFWADGRTSYLTAYVSATEMTAYPSQTVASQPACYNPTSRKFNDTVGDDTLRDRINGLSLQNRFHVPLPDCRLVVITGSLMMVAERDTNSLYYSQIPSKEIYRAGFYNEAHQLVIFKDIIRHLHVFKDRVAVLCVNSTHAVPTNSFGQYVYEDIGEVVLIITAQYEIDDTLGCLDYGSIQKLPNGLIRLKTNDGAIRDFNGSNYSDTDHAYNRIRKKIRKLANASASAFHKSLGYLLWGRE